MKKKTKIIIAIIVLVIVIVITATLLILKTDSKVDIIKDSFIFEFGEILDIDVSDIIKAEEEILKTAKIDFDNIIYTKKNLSQETDEFIPAVGAYVVKLNYKVKNKEKAYNIDINIVDTTEPSFTDFTESIEIKTNNKISDFSKYFKGTDLSEFEIIVDDSNVDYSIAGEYEISITIKDIYGNSYTQTSKIIIAKDEVSNNTNTNYNYNSTCTSTTTVPLYVSDILVVNKKNPLPCGYAPGENAEAASKAKELIADMQVLGFSISSSYSGYRSYETQKTLYTNYVLRDGQTLADTYSARPGYSEHQTGLAYDIKMKSGTMVKAGTVEAEWIAENAHLYGFIVRYLKGKESITGYQYEPWHLRYVGVDNATKIKASGLCLEEYLGIEGGDYL